MPLLKKLTLRCRYLKTLTHLKVHDYIYSIQFEGANSFVLWAPHLKSDISNFGKLQRHVSEM